MTKLILAFHNFANRPKNCKVCFLQTACENVKWIEMAQTREEEGGGGGEKEEERGGGGGEEEKEEEEEEEEEEAEEEEEEEEDISCVHPTLVRVMCPSL